MEKSLDNMDRGIAPVAKVLLVLPGVKKPFCGPGMITLLAAIEKTGNVLHACESIGLSYSKGWKLLRAVEAWLGFTVTIRKQGGKGGGEAHLTDKGRDFLEKHRAFLDDCRNAVQRLFTDYYQYPRDSISS